MAKKFGCLGPSLVRNLTDHKINLSMGVKIISWHAKMSDFPHQNCIKWIDILFLFFSNTTESWPHKITYHATPHSNQPINAQEKIQQLTSADGGGSLSVKSWNFTWKYQWILKEKSIMSEKSRRRKTSQKFSPSDLLRSKMKILLFLTIFGSGKPQVIFLLERTAYFKRKERKNPAIHFWLQFLVVMRFLGFCTLAAVSHIHERS